ncbi:MAG: uroporphyrinogen decarboxylase family protein [Saccharofermentanales bacterium]
MNGKERIKRILKRLPTDRVGIYDQFWTDTVSKWITEGKIEKFEDLADRFDFDIMATGGINLMADPDFVQQVVKEDDETITYLDGNGATFRWHKKRTGVYEHIAFTVTCREDWEKHIKPKLNPTPNRLNYEAYRAGRELAEKTGMFLAFYSSNVFSHMTAISGHEHILFGMADDPVWIQDMCKTYADLQCEMQDMLFSQEGWPDCLWYTEDLGYKLTPFMSKDMFGELLLPGYIQTIDHCHRHDTPVVFHTCGFMEPLLPQLVDAGIDALQSMEVKAGMDTLRIFENWGDRLTLIGGMDARTLETNDKEIVKAELDKKLPILMQNNGYVFHSDHSISDKVEYETFEFFENYGRKLGAYDVKE